MSAVYLWFGVSQLINPTNFIGYLPGFIFSSPYATAFVIGNGVFEVIAGGLLLSGKFTRIAALLLGLHLCGIAIELGYGDVAVRDFGLMLATMAIALHGPDNWCLDARGLTKRDSHETV